MRLISQLINDISRVLQKLVNYFNSTVKNFKILFIVLYKTYTVSKWCTVFKYYYFFSFVSSFCSIICSWCSNCYSSTNNYVGIAILAWIWPYHWSFKFNLITSVIRSSWLIFCFNTISWSKFRFFILCFVLLFFDVPLLDYIFILILDHEWFPVFIQKTSFFMYFSIKSNIFFLICNWIILRWSFWGSCNSISNFISNQITIYFCSFLNFSFWRSFKCICSRLFSMIKKFLTVFTAWTFSYIFTNNFPIFLAKDKNP